jgi:hypothetical protein
VLFLRTEVPESISKLSMKRMNIKYNKLHHRNVRTIHSGNSLTLQQNRLKKILLAGLEDLTSLTYAQPCKCRVPTLFNTNQPSFAIPMICIYIIPVLTSTV